jgi:hypothetical protein
MNTYETSSQYGGQGISSSENKVQQREGKIARTIENQTAKVPSDVFLWAAGAAVVGSLALQIFGMRRTARAMGPFGAVGVHARAPLASFIGMWVPSLLLLGVYNKIVKVAGSDRFER